MNPGSFLPELLTALSLPDEVIRAIYLGIGSGEQPHGSFLTNFANALNHADPENFGLMRPVACVLIVRYRLDKEYRQAVLKRAAGPAVDCFPA